MRIDVWSDLVCPWCYIGRRRLSLALAQFPHAHEVEVGFRSFQLDPGAPVGHTRLQAEVMVEKFGASPEQVAAMEANTARTAQADGLEFLPEGILSGNTADAHRLVHLARDRGREDEVVDRLYRAHFADHRSIFDRESLAELGQEAGLDATESRRALQGDAYSDAVQADIRKAAELGVTGVPFFLLGQRYGVSGAQAPEVLLEALGKAWEETVPDRRSA